MSFQRRESNNHVVRRVRTKINQEGEAARRAGKRPGEPGSGQASREAVTARLTVRVSHGAGFGAGQSGPAGGGGALVVRMTARWRVYAGPGQRAVITGSAGRARLAATATAP